MSSAIKKYLLAGFLVLVPIYLTLWVLKSLIMWGDTLITQWLPNSWQPPQLFGFAIPGLGLLAAVIFVLLTGILTRLYFGRKFFELTEKWMQKIPLGRAIFTSTQQLMKVFFSPQSTHTRKPVLIEFPVAGQHVIGFITSDSATLSSNNTEKMVAVFVPTTPNPTSGFLIFIPQTKIKPMDITTEQAFKLVLSGGTLQD